MHRLISGILAFLILALSTGFSMEMHYCKGKLFSVGLNTEAEFCSAAKDNLAQENEQRDWRKASCCGHFEGYFHLDQDSNSEGGHSLTMENAATPLLLADGKSVHQFDNRMMKEETYYRPPPNIRNLSISFSVLRI